jgi:hypothetical protein
MPSIRPGNRFSYAMNATALLAMTIVTCVSSLPAHAVTCEDVRHLSAAEQEFWSKRLNITSEQRHRIWIACYRDYRSGRPTRDELALRQAN